MNLKGQNNIRTKQTNRSQVLQALLRLGRTSRQNIAELTHLTSATITNLTAELIREGLVREVGNLEENRKRAGRKFIALSLHEDAYWAVGVHISFGQLEFGLVNLGGSVKKQRKLDIPAALSEQQFADLLLTELQTFMDGIQEVDVQAIGIGCLGLINFENGVVLDAKPMNWQNIRLAELVASAFKLPVYVDNNVRCMALAEKMFGGSKLVGHFLCLFIGEGIGSGLVLNDDVYRGGVTGAGEIGHVTYVHDGFDCWCGNRGCLEQYASNAAIVRQLKAPSLDAVIQDCLKGNAEAQKAIRQAGRAVGTVLASYINMFHVDQIVIAGHLADENLPFMPAVREEVARRSFLFNREKVEIAFATIREQIGVIGAASLALHYEVFKK
jgi:predicted NBD/HSP70 family sugar kinase